MNRRLMLLAAGLFVIAGVLPAVAGSTTEEDSTPSLLNDGNAAAGSSGGHPAYTVDQPAYRAVPTEPAGSMRFDLGTGGASGTGFIVPAPIGPDPPVNPPGQPSRH